MNSSFKMIGFCFAAAVTAAPAFAQVDSVGDGKRQLVALRQQEAEVRQRIGQLQLDALIERVGRAADRAETNVRRLPRSVAHWTAADLDY